jgi:hypothetical protein
MNNASNDDKNPFNPLGAFAARVLMKTYQVGDEHKDGAGDGEPEQRRKSGERAEREYVESGAQQIAKFERQARGEWRRPRRGGPR